MRPTKFLYPLPLPFPRIPRRNLDVDWQVDTILHDDIISLALYPELQEEDTERAKREQTHINRIIKPQIPIQPPNLLHLPPLQLPSARHIQILRQPSRIITLRDNRDVPLRGPPEQHLRGRLPMFRRDLLDGTVVHEQGGVVRFLHVEF